MSTREASVAKIAEVLASHVVQSGGVSRDGLEYELVCECGHRNATVNAATRERLGDKHRTHVAEALASAGIGWAGALAEGDWTAVWIEDRAYGWRSVLAALGRAFGAKED